MGHTHKVEMMKDLCRQAESAVVKARVQTETARGEVERLKEALNKTNADLARREKELQEAATKIIEAEKKVEDLIAAARQEAEERIVEACQSAMEAFKVLVVFKQEKAQAVDSFKASKGFYDAMVVFG